MKLNSTAVLILSIVDIAFISAALVVGTHTAAAQTLFQGNGESSSGSFNAKDVYNNPNMINDVDVTNLVILIPEKNLINYAFLPTSTTVAYCHNC